ncbi:MAG: hypothetical protein R3328_03445 [Planococcaceae bacterium]|nr:hypothetical protein [Planococcaceae bacterium]
MLKKLVGKMASHSSLGVTVLDYFLVWGEVLNGRLIELFLKSEVEKLSEENKRLYKFIVKNEDLLAQRAETADQFRKLLVEKSPYILASRYFDIPFAQVFLQMSEIENELNIRVEKRCQQAKWIDMTDRMFKNSIGESHKKMFFFIS